MYEDQKDKKLASLYSELERLDKQLTHLDETIRDCRSRGEDVSHEEATYEKLAEEYAKLDREILDLEDEDGDSEEESYADYLENLRKDGLL